MWWKLCLVSLVALAYANHNPAWRHNNEYVYEVRGSSLTSFNQINANYTGLLLKARLAVRPRSDGHLGAQILNLQYAEVHTQLPDGWLQDIPDSEANYQPVPLASGPFKILMNNNVVTDIIVDKAIPNWESNMIKGIVSQLQLDTEAENQIRSSINIFTQEGSNNAVFKTMEETVSGESETLYEIHPFPRYVIESQPCLAPLTELDKNAEIIEVLKTTNYTNSQETPSYHFGFDAVDNFESANTIAEFFTRSSISRALLSGTLKNFIIQSSSTVDSVSMRPNLQDKQRGSTNTIVNLTLSTLQPSSQEFPDVSNPISVGLVYRYDQPFSDSNEPQPRFLQSQDRFRSREKDAADILLSSSESSNGSPDPEEYSRVQDQPHMQEAPASPLLPFTVGYEGQAIGKKQNIRETVRTLARKIGQEFQQPANIPDKNTVGKFLLLSTLVKTMNYEELKQVTGQLYKEEEQGADAAAWVAYRDAVAQSGTGPALLSIEEWIRQNQIEGFEAAQVVATAATAARHPTEKYMKVFFGMIQNQEIMLQRYLNESILLSYATLVNQVYVNEGDSHDKYPVHSFGSFNTAQGRLFVVKEVIPYLTAKLQNAISQGKTQDIHVYIRALGNIGHQQILSTFKPYLEGTKKVSQLQRVLMVMALNNLVENNPVVARSVLYKIYQNTKDFDQVRVAAVFQLILTNPPPEMLQRMARYTNIDPSVHVNSAVKSAIESATELNVPKHEHLRVAAESAKPLLTPQEFGAQNAKTILQNFVVEGVQMEVKQILNTFNGDDSLLPKGLNYWLRTTQGGVKENVIYLQSIVSSIEDLVNVFEQQTKNYNRLLKEKQAYESVKTKWSSEYIAKLLNLQNEQREQMEGYLYLHLRNLESIWSFDNQTVENITELVMEWETELKSGKQFNYQRMVNTPELAVSFPTAWGLPFIYTYDRPVLLNAESRLQAEAKPSLSTAEGLQVPEVINLDYQVKVVISGRSQSQFGTFAPFNHKRYSAGYDKNFHLDLPKIRGKVHVDVENRQTTWQFELAERPSNNLFHFSTWPHTSQYEIDSLTPRNEIISSNYPQRIKTVLGQKETGIAVSLEVTSDQNLDYAFFFDKLQNEGLLPSLLGSWLDDTIQHVDIKMGIDASKSSAHKLILHLGQQQKFLSREASDAKLTRNNPLALSLSKESWERQKEFLKNSTSGINNVQGYVLDAVMLFEGEKTWKYSLTFAGATSNIDPKGRLLLQAQQHDNNKVFLTAESKIPSPPSLNLNSALEFDPTSLFEVKTNFEQKGRAPSEINLKVKLSQSEQRVKYLKQQAEYEDCQKEMQQGNNQLPVCAELTGEANLLDTFDVSLDYKNVEPSLVNNTYKWYSVLRHYLYPYVSENIIAHGQPNQNRLNIRGQYSPDLSYLNASVESDYGRAEFNNIEVNDLWQSILIPNPGYSPQERLEALVFNYPAYEPNCVVDDNAVNSLDNKTYPVRLDNDWVVLLQYVPRRPSPIENQPDLTVSEQLKEQIEGYIIYGRAPVNNKSNKEIKIVIQSPNTRGRVIDVTLKPSDNGYPKLFVQNEQVIYDDRGSHIYDNYMQVYKLPNNEMQVDVYESLSLVYDGTRAKINIIDDKFRDATRGLCGTFTGEPETDFTHPGNCIIQSPEVFVATNTVPEKQRTKRINDMLMIQAEEKMCYHKKIGYARIISAQDSGLASGHLQVSSSSPYKMQTKYADEGDLTCFSLTPLRLCKSGFRAETVAKLVPVHCVKAGQVADLWKQEINRGASPDFSFKAPSKSLMMNVAERCAPFNSE